MTSTRYADATLAAYRRHAGRAIGNWGRLKRPSRFLRQFAGRLRPGARVLDYGCGVGTDLAWLRARGFRVEGLDGTEAFVEAAKRRNPGVAVRCQRFEHLQLPERAFDGIWCNAALIHVPPSELARQIAGLRRSLIAGGWLGLSLAWGRVKTYTANDWIPGRYIAGYSKAEAAGFFDGWRIEELRVVSHDGRQGRWIQLLATHG